MLDIIEDSKKSSTLRSAEMYLDAVELSVANATLDNNVVTDGTYNILDTGDICLKYDSENKCSNILEVEVNGEAPSSGTITISNGVISGVEIVLGDKTIVKNSDGELVYQEAPTGPTLASCEFKSGTEKAIGAKYSCDFGGGAKNFYILELGSNKVEGSLLKDDEVALILEGNYDTTTQAWCASGSDNSCAADGLTSKLNDIATAWKELEREQIVLPSALQVATADGKDYTDYPTISSDNAWLYNWPDNADYGNSAPYGYWTSSPLAEDSGGAWYVRYNGGVNLDYVDRDYYSGVRPVINLKI